MKTINKNKFDILTHEEQTSYLFSVLEDVVDKLQYINKSDEPLEEKDVKRIVKDMIENHSWRASIHG